MRSMWPRARMPLFWFSVLALLSSGCTLFGLDDPSPSAPPATKWENEPTTYRDFPFGGSIKEFEAAFHTKVDPAHSCTKENGLTECVGHRLAGWTGSLGIPPPEVGFDVSEYFMFADPGVFVRATWSLDAHNFDEAVRFLVSKYGSPNATRAGRSDEYLWWYGQKVNFFAQRLQADGIDPKSLILFEERAFTEQLATKSREQKGKAKKAF